MAANAPALATLRLPRLPLSVAALGPLCDALPRNTHLRELHFAFLDDAADASAAPQLLPAVRANTSLRLLRTSVYHALPSLHEAVPGAAGRRARTLR